MNPLHREKQVARRSPFLIGAMLRWRFLLAAGLAIGLQTDQAIEYFTGPVRGLSRAVAASGHFMPDWLIQTGPYLPAIFCLIRAAYLIVYAWSCSYVLTDQRLIVRYGVITRVEDEVELYRVNDVALTRTILQRLIGVGDIHVSSTDRTGFVTLPLLRGANEFRDAIRNAAEHFKNRRGAVRLIE